MWGLGLNGNPISDLGVGTLARALAGRASLRDIGITLSDVTDAGIQQLADSVTTCKHLRFIYLYTSGFKAATKITDAGKVRERARGTRRCAELAIPQRRSRRASARARARLLTAPAHRPRCRQAYLRSKLPLYATAAFDHKLSRYLKSP